jgi:hypothetical protein
MSIGLFMSIEVLMSVVFFWIVTLYGLVGGYQYFRGADCLDLYACWKQYGPPKHWYKRTSPHDIKTQTITVDIRFYSFVLLHRHRLPCDGRLFMKCVPFVILLLC